MPSPLYQKTWQVGEAILAADMNSNIRDGFNYQLTNRPAARGRNTGTGTQLTTGTWTVVAFATQDYDITDNTFSTSDRMDIVVPGLYMVTGVVHYLNNGTGGRAMRFTVNGTAQVGLSGTATCNDTGGIGTGVCLTRLMYLAKGDILRMEGFQSSGGNLFVQSGSEGCSLQVIWMSSDTFLG